MRIIQGGFEARGRRFAVVASRFNDVVVKKLVEGAVSCLRKHGIADDDLDVVWVPGAFELPLVSKRMAVTGGHDAVICLGAVIRGDTAHFDYVAGEAARGIRQASMETGVPVIFGVLTTDTFEQAMDRAGGKHGNKGWDAAMAAMETASVLEQIDSGVQGGSSPAERSGTDQAAAVPLAEAARRRRAAEESQS
jgi:6,7-dimethyl-8-ribityllumazine synthase